MFSIIINQILKMLLLLLLGYFCYRKNFINQEGNRMLANFLLMIVNPALAIISLQIDYRPELVRGLLISYLLAFATHIGAVLLSTVLLRRKSDPNLGINRFFAIYSNCGFMGIPLVQSILGQEGVLYLTAYLTVFNLFSWTHGIAVLTGELSFKSLKKGLLSPMVLASAVGLVLFFGQIRIPAVFADAMNYVAGMNTPLAMIIAGISVAQTDLIQMLKKRSIYLIAAGKLFLMPLAVLLLLYLFPVSRTVAYTILIASACPSAATGTAFALRFHKDYRYASELYAFTTIASLITIPMIAYAAELVLPII